MKQINGPGAVIGFCACIAAGLVCGCIPAMIGCILVALGGVVWDFMRGNVTGKKRSPCGAATPTRRKRKNTFKYNIPKKGAYVNGSGSSDYPCNGAER